MEADLAPQRVWAEGVEFLAEDPHFAPVVQGAGPVVMDEPASSAFAHLVRAVIYQQLAGAAAAAIEERVVAALGGTVRPERILGTSTEALRGAGLSRAKLKTIRALAEAASAGEVRLEAMDGLDDEAVRRTLTQVWGIGPWTADMFLMFRLRRPDVWPVGDLGVRAGWARIHGLDSRPSPGELSTAAAHLVPWRSVAAWYCWRALELDLDP